MNLSELKTLLNKLGVRPKKGLSQNFLVDRNIIEKILREAVVKEGDYILEIGPGPGGITEELVKKKAEVIAVELDPVFSEALQHLPATIYQEDFLTFPLDHLKKKGKVVANLPYHITAPILTRLVPRRDLFSTLTVIVQEEVARRITASPKTKEYSSLTVFLNFYATARYAFRVSKHCFYPVPKVDSAVVTFTLNPPPEVDPEMFFQLVRTAFSQRRKMLKNTLAKLYPDDKIREALEKMKEPMGIDLKSRAEELSLEAFLELYRRIG